MLQLYALACRIQRKDQGRHRSACNAVEGQSSCSRSGSLMSIFLHRGKRADVNAACPEVNENCYLQCLTISVVYS